MGSVEMTPYVLTFNGSNLVIKSPDFVTQKIRIL